ncbi:MAG TPA: hypothetical protein VHZ26_15055 [Caulobacteraceae bacterium]|jgi:hypothetical protein|nr:hypothetical protein [Caulobacteraceae bacterium]
MPSSYTAQNRLEEQNPGENLNTWGSRLNANTTALIDFAISGYTALAISGAITLSSANGAADQARSAILDFTSGSGGTVTIPGVSHVYQVRNNTSGAVVFTTGSGTTATVEAGSFATVICDATNCYRFADAADIAACLTAANAYATGLAFSSSSGQLPGQAGNAGNFLTTNGSTANWAPALPSQTGQAGGVLTTNGSAAAWNTGLSSSLANTASSQTGISGSLANVSTSLAGVSSSLGGLSTSLAGVSSSVAAMLQPGTGANAQGYLGLPQTTKSASYTAALADSGTELFFSGSHTATIPANASVAFAIGAVLVFSTSGTLTVSITSDTMTWIPTGATGSRAVTGPGFLIARKVSATGWWVYGLGVT